MISTSVVYVIGAAESPVKIGIATSLADRLCQLQIGNPDLLVCHHFVRVPATRALAVEQAAHKAFADRHRRGEWFDIDWREAAKLLDDMARIEGASQAPDIFQVLRAEHGMKAEGKEVVWDYLDRQERSDPYVPHANGYIMKRVGTAAYAAFSVVIAQQKTVSGLRPSEREAALKALAEAINVLCNFRRQHARADWVARETRNMDRMIADEASLRPRSLPPIRAA